MARTIRTKLYKFHELGKDAQQKALDNYEPFTENIFDDAGATFKKFADIFAISWRTIDFLEPYRNDYRINAEDRIFELKGRRLQKYIWNNYRTDLFKGKYYGKLVNTYKTGEKIEVSKEHPAGLRHVKYYSKCQLSNECVLTGVCYDDSILQPIYDFLNERNPSMDYEELLNSCISALCKDVQNEYEANFSDEVKRESIEANEYEFLKDGTKY